MFLSKVIKNNKLVKKVNLKGSNKVVHVLNKTKKVYCSTLPKEEGYTLLDVYWTMKEKYEIKYRETLTEKLIVGLAIGGCYGAVNLTVGFLIDNNVVTNLLVFTPIAVSVFKAYIKKIQFENDLDRELEKINCKTLFTEYNIKHLMSLKRNGLIDSAIDGFKSATIPGFCMESTRKIYKNLTFKQELKFKNKIANIFKKIDK